MGRAAKDTIYNLVGIKQLNSSFLFHTLLERRLTLLLLVFGGMAIMPMSTQALRVIRQGAGQHTAAGQGITERSNIIYILLYILVYWASCNVAIKVVEYVLESTAYAAGCISKNTQKERAQKQIPGMILPVLCPCGSLFCLFCSLSFSFGSGRDRGWERGKSKREKERLRERERSKRQKMRRLRLPAEPPAEQRRSRAAIRAATSNPNPTQTAQQQPARVDVGRVEI